MIHLHLPRPDRDHNLTIHATREDWRDPWDLEIYEDGQVWGGQLTHRELMRVWAMLDDELQAQREVALGF